MENEKYKLSNDEIKRINNAQEYERTKTIISNMEQLKHFEVGSVILLKNRVTGAYKVDGIRSSNRDSILPPNKYLVIKNDNGFLFVKRIITSGKPGILVECITTEYSLDIWEVILDEEYIDAILLDKQYDPTATQKEFKDKKNKISKLNDKKRIRFETASEAYTFLSNLKVGDELWQTRSTFGSGAEIMKVKKINIIDIDSDNLWKSKVHIDAGFDKVISVELASTVNKWGKISITFCDITKGYNLRSALFLYHEKPLNIRDINE